LQIKSTCFVLGNFAKKYPKIIKKLFDEGHEIASHGNTHELVNEMEFSNWENSIKESKKILENIIGEKIFGYRSASWSLPFENRYYEALARHGYTFSSSYFPFKTYMYGNSIDKKQPFTISTKYGKVLEIPLARHLLPFSGGFYLRILPLVLQKYLSKKLLKNGIKTIVYVHPYEMLNDKIMAYFKEYVNYNKDYFLAFFEFGNTIDKIRRLSK